MKRPDTALPPKVERHVRQQLKKRDWESLLSDLRTMCADCPAERDPDICINCPLEGIALDAATLTLKARIARLQDKAAGKHNV